MPTPRGVRAYDGVGTGLGGHDDDNHFGLRVPSWRRGAVDTMPMSPPTLARLLRPFKLMTALGGCVLILGAMAAAAVDVAAGATIMAFGIWIAAVGLWNWHKLSRRYASDAPAARERDE